ncbi:MAG TPA: T9SS type A sorting domain-containing protein, partial [Ignavibacteria bacterium]|nr:T9SS type A sorting domain-containing protein [Ignavibacteria bacterium]
LNQGQNIAIVKYNPAGVQQWVRYYNGASNGNESVRDMKIDVAGNIYLTGYSFSSVSNLDYITIKYNPAGTLQWAARYIGDYLAGDNVATSLELDSEGNVYVTGGSREYAAGSDITTLKYDPSGSMVWVMKKNGNVNSSYQENGRCLSVDNINNVFVGGVNDASDGIIIKYVQAPIGIQPIGNEIPEKYSLSQNYPNPFNPSTTIRFALPEGNLTTVKIYDITGAEVKELANEFLYAGLYSVNFNASSLSSGTYFCRLTSGKFTDVKKMILVK